jgi:hypothetical protein
MSHLVLELLARSSQAQQRRPINLMGYKLGNESIQTQQFR